MEHGPGLKMYFLLKMGIFQPAMLGITRGYIYFESHRAAQDVYQKALKKLEDFQDKKGGDVDL